MAMFDLHKKCMRCCDRGVGTDPCVEDFEHCNSLTSDQKLQLASPTCKTRKEKEKKSASALPLFTELGSVEMLGEVKPNLPAQKMENREKSYTHQIIQQEEGF